MKPTRELAERFWARVDRSRGDGGCWVWVGKFVRCPEKYGRLYVGDRTYVAHRFAKELCGDPVPEGMVGDHMCRNTLCVNPAHIRAVTRRINAIENNVGAAARHAQQTHCKHGHPLVDGNLKSRPDKPTWRICLTCYQSQRRELRRERRKHSTPATGTLPQQYSCNSPG